MTELDPARAEAAIAVAWGAWAEAGACWGVAGEEVEDCDLAQVRFSFGDEDAVECDEEACDVTFGAGPWVTLGDACQDAFYVEAVAQAEIGELLGAPQDDIASCTTPAVSDTAPLAELYGPAPSFVATTPMTGPIPLRVCFDAETNARSDHPVSMLWRFGDGETSLEEDPCHDYADEGAYDVSLEVVDQAPQCASWTWVEGAMEPVAACRRPHAASADLGFFSYERLGVRRLRMVNQLDRSPAECVTDIEWDVFKGDERILTRAAWAPMIELPRAGRYRIVLDAGGPGGVSAEDLVVDTRNGGCSHAPLPASWVCIIAAGLLPSRRRRDGGCRGRSRLRGSPCTASAMRPVATSPRARRS